MEIKKCFDSEKLITDKSIFSRPPVLQIIVGRVFCVTVHCFVQMFYWNIYFWCVPLSASSFEVIICLLQLFHCVVGHLMNMFSNSIIPIVIQKWGVTHSDYYKWTFHFSIRLSFVGLLTVLFKNFRLQWNFYRVFITRLFIWIYLLCPGSSDIRVSDFVLMCGFGVICAICYCFE